MTTAPSKPVTQQGDLSALPAALSDLTRMPRWVVWRWVHVPDRQRWSKVPYQAAHASQKAKSNDPATWGDYRTAVAAVMSQRADGIGFMLLDADIAAFDLDDCRDVASGLIAPWAIALIQDCASYAEVTVSGTGIRIIGTAQGPTVHRKQKLIECEGSIETYRRAARFIVVTGLQVAQSSGCLASLDAVIDKTVTALDGRKNSGSSAQGEIFEARARLPTRLDHLVRFGVAEGQRSEQFHHVVGWLKQLGWSVDGICDLLSTHPAGIASKYLGRLAPEVQRCFDKTEGPRDERTKSQTSDQSRRAQTKIELHWHGEQSASAIRKWLVENLVPETGKGLLSGQWGTAKTFTALDLAASVMTGLAFAGRHVTRRGGVLFVAAEGANEIPLRLNGLVEHKLRPALDSVEPGGAVPAPNLESLPFAWIEHCPPLKEASSLEALLDVTRAASEHLTWVHGLPLGLIVIDTLAAGADFDDANDAAEGQRVMNRLEGLSRETGAFVLAVDHFGKAVETGTRGTSAKEAAADVVLALLAERDIAGTISNTRLAVRKLRGGSTGTETPFTLEVVSLTAGGVVIPQTTCVLRWKPSRESQESDARPQDRWPQSLRIFKAAIGTALIEHGETVKPFGREGPQVKAVDATKGACRVPCVVPVRG